MLHAWLKTVPLKPFKEDIVVFYLEKCKMYVRKKVEGDHSELGMPP